MISFAMAVTYPAPATRRRRLHADPARPQEARHRHRLSRTAPAATTKDTFLRKGEADPAKSREHGLAIGTTPAGPALALGVRLGKFKLLQLIARRSSWRPQLRSATVRGHRAVVDRARMAAGRRRSCS
jgi:hypothetical protein